MDAISLLNARMNGTGGGSEGRSIRQKRRSMEIALKDSYQAETITFNGIEYRCLINNYKNKMDYDDKIISIGYESGMKVGDVFSWDRVNKNCIVYLEEMSEDAYFRAHIRMAEHTLKWKDQYGIERNTIAAVRGPVETVVRGQMKKNTAYDQPNHTLDMIVPLDDVTKELVRYKRIALEGKVWEISATDPISEPGILNLSLVEDFYNRDRDEKDLVDGKVPINLEVVNSIEGVLELETLVPLTLTSKVYIDSVQVSELESDTIYSMVSGDATISGNVLTTNSDGVVEVLVSIPKINYSKTYTLESKTIPTSNIESYQINGNFNVKSYGSQTYSIETLVNGAKQPNIGIWSVVLNPELFTITSQNADEIVLKWITGKSGQVILEYLVSSSIVATETIEVKTLL